MNVRINQKRTEKRLVIFILLSYYFGYYTLEISISDQSYELNLANIMQISRDNMVKILKKIP